MLALNVSNRALNLTQAMQRLETLFGARSPQRRAREMARSTATIDHYLSNNNFSQPVSAELREVLIALDADISAVHQAMPYGRGNVLVKDAAAPGASPVVNQRHTLQKTSLMLLAQRMEQIMPGAKSGPMRRSISQAALGILAGAGSCDNYAYTLALVAAQRCNELGLGDYAQIEIYAHPKLATSSARIDHAYVVMNFTDSEENVHRIILDPWADKNRVVLEEHSQYRKARLKEDGEHLELVDHRIADLIATEMRYASDNYMERAGNSSTYDAHVSGMETALRVHNPAQRHDVLHPLAGYVDATVDFAHAGVRGAAVRRPSIDRPGDSPLISNG